MRMQLPLVMTFLLFWATTSFADEAIEKLISRLGEGKNEVNDEIVRRGKPAVTPLAKVLHDEKVNHLIRLDAALLLGRIGGKDVVKPLRTALADKNVTVRYFAILALGDVGRAADDAVPELAKLLSKRAKDDNLSVERRELIEVLGKIGGDSQEAVDALVLCMNDRHCNEAALALTKFGEPGAEALITLAVKYLKDERSQNERRYGEAYLAVAWGMPPLPKEMIPVFKKHFEKDDAQSRIVAGYALAGVGPEAIPILAKYLDSKDAGLRAAAAESLGTMNWFAARSKKQGENTVTPVSSEEYFPKLKKLYKMPNGDVDFRIILAMMKIDDNRFRSDPELVKVLQDEFIKGLNRQPERRKD